MVQSIELQPFKATEVAESVHRPDPVSVLSLSSLTDHTTILGGGPELDTPPGGVVSKIFVEKCHG